MCAQTGVVDPRDLGVVLEELRDFHRVFADAVHAQRQRFKPLQNHKGVKRANRRAHIAQRHGAGATYVGSIAKGFGVNHAVVADFGRAQALETFSVLRPREFAAIDNHAANAGAVASNVFG